MEFNDFQILIILFSIVLLTILGIVFTLFFLFQKKKIEFLLREKEQEKQFDETLKKTQIEIQESALKNIAWELHDNVGQLLSLARMELNIVHATADENVDKIGEISNIIGDSLQEIRSLSKTLNAEIINNIGLVQSIQIEIDRFNRLNFITTHFEVIGEEREIPNKDEIILFRMVQEFFSNTIKHSKATTLDITVNFNENELKVFVKDNGQGFDVKNSKLGSGLLNIKSRAAIINTKLNYDSDSNGTRMELIYPINKV